MKTRKLILSGAIALILAAMLGNVVLAGEIGIGVPTDGTLQVYLIKKAFDICDPALGGFEDNFQALPGGSMPPSGQQFGCVKIIGERLNEYLFTGEQMAVLVAARNTLGSEGIHSAALSVDGEMKVECNQVTVDGVDGLGSCQLKANQTEPMDRTCESITDETTCDTYPVRCEWIGPVWYGHDVSQDLCDQPPAKTAGTHNGFDPAYDKLYECIYTATDSDSGETDVMVVVSGKDAAGSIVEAESVPDLVFFNPEILIDVSTSDGDSVTFAQGSSGQTVYSTNTLMIKNEAEGGVDLVAWLAGTDLVSSTENAKCPYSNVLDVDEYMDYRCKIGTLFNNPWNDVHNPDDTKDCTISSCQNALPLTPQALMPSILANGHTAECWFRLYIPVPCFGTFDQGEILIYARAI
jgi:hypothetical protein